MARIAAIFSLSCGAVVDLAGGRYAGKAQGESSLFRTIWDVFRPGDIVLTDALLCTWAEILLLKQRGVDFVGQLHVNREADFRRGKRLGKKDHIDRWPKPFVRWMDKESRKALPDFLEVRESCISIQQTEDTRSGAHSDHHANDQSFLTANPVRLGDCPGCSSRNNDLAYPGAKRPSSRSRRDENSRPMTNNNNATPYSAIDFLLLVIHVK